MKRKPIMLSPYRSFPGTWLVSAIAAVIFFLFALGFLSVVHQYKWTILPALAFLYVGWDYAVQSVLWFRDREVLKKQWDIEAQQEWKANKESIALLKGLVKRKGKNV